MATLWTLYKILPTNYYVEKISVISYDVCVLFFVKKMWNQFSMYIRIYDILRNTTSIYGIILVCIITGGKTSNTGGFNVNNILFGEMPFSGCNKFVNL